jgi:cytochrome c-type biogenesis protein CcmF
VFVPLMAPALFLMGVGPLARWREARLGDLAHRLRWAAGVSVASAVLAPLVLQSWSPLTGLGLLLAVWIAATAILNLVTRLREHPAPGWAARVRAQPGSYWGMLLAHFGVAVFIVGVTAVGSFQSESDVRMEVGDTTRLAGYSLRLEQVQEVRGPNYVSARAVLSVSRDGQADHAVTTLMPERRIYTVSRMPMTEVAIDRGVTRDLYVALGAPVSNTAWSVRVHHKPFVNWIWGGCVLMALGGVLAVLDRRYRVRRSAAAPAAVNSAAPPMKPANPLLAGKGALR